MSLPIKVFTFQAGQAVSHLAHTLDISRGGALISDAPYLDSPGQEVTIQYGEKKARFRVAWVGTLGTPTAGQAGLRALDGQPYIWDVELPTDISDEHEQPVVQHDRRQQDDRRSSPRFESGGGVQCWKEGDIACLYGKLANLSRGGCFIETKSPFPAGSVVRLQFIVSGVKLLAKGEVQTVRPDKGMGVSFKSFAGQSDEKLDALLNSLIHKASSQEKQSGSLPLMSRSEKLALKLERWFRQNENLSREQYLKLLTGRKV